MKSRREVNKKKGFQGREHTAVLLLQASKTTQAVHDFSLFSARGWHKTGMVSFGMDGFKSGSIVNV